jgi:transposase
VGDAQIERVVRMTLRSAPADATHWSTRAMAKRCGLSQSMVSHIWRPLRCNRIESRASSFRKTHCSSRKCATSSGFTSIRPTALVLCVDEKSQIQGLDRSQPLLPMRPGQAERRAPDYVRHDTTNLFAALDFKAVTVIGQFHRRHRAVEFRQFLETIDHQVSRRFVLHLIIDNYATHKTPAIKRWLRRRFHLHFTPTGASWLDLVERWFAGLTEKPLRRGVHRSTRELQDAIRHYLELNNRHPKLFIWTKTADQILESVARFCKRTSQDTR